MELHEFIGSWIREYRIDSIIGEGGMGAVFKAEHRLLGATRALKILKSDISQDSDFVKRFEREARILARLDHSNLVRVYEFFKEGRHLALVMEFLVGESLSVRLRRARIMSAQEILPIIIQVCDGLIHAHSHGIIHRDISPDNIMLTTRKDRLGSPLAKVIDFGIAKAEITDRFAASDADEKTSTGLFIGKIDYCSPEQAKGAAIDHRTDQYSLGLVLFRALTGKFPFSSASKIESLALRIREQVPDIREMRVDVEFSRELTDTVGKMLERERDKRFTNMTEVRNALIGVLNTSAGDGREDTTSVFSTGDQKTHHLYKAETDQPHDELPTLAQKPVSEKKETPEKGKLESSESLSASKMVKGLKISDSRSYKTPLIAAAVVLIIAILGWYGLFKAEKPSPDGDRESQANSISLTEKESLSVEGAAGVAVPIEKAENDDGTSEDALQDEAALLAGEPSDGDDNEDAGPDKRNIDGTETSALIKPLDHKYESVAPSPSPTNTRTTVPPPSPTATPAVKLERVATVIPPASGGWFGASIETVTEYEARQLGLGSLRGVRIVSVVSGGPADAAGLRGGDILTSIDGRKINDAREAGSVLQRKSPGQKAALTVYRLGRLYEAKVTLGKRN